ILKSVCKHYDIDMDIPVKDIPKKQMNKILKGSGRTKIHFHYVNDFGKVRDNMIQFEGVLNNIARRYHETSSDFTREHLEKYMAQKDYQRWDGYRVKKEELGLKK